MIIFTREAFTKIKKDLFWILIIIIAAFLVRTYDFSFPYFTSDEARIAYRGYSLATSGRDELGRSFPFIFNSLEDYQLPAVSYITALGILIFGKTEFGARIPFILISVLITILIYKVSKIFGLKKEFRLFCALIVAFSPALIFFSKIPNEIIVLTFGLTALFYLLTKKKVNLLGVGFTMVFVLVTSKVSWWVLIPFTIFTLRFFRRDLLSKTEIKIMLMSLLLVLFSALLFLQVPQAKRSFLENDFPIFQDTSMKVAVNRFRGQGLESGWPNFVEKIVFNKGQFVFVGFLNWVNHLEPAILFGRFDSAGIQGFSSMGAFPKMAIIPFVAGLLFIIRKSDFRLKALFFYLLILTFPVFFIYPGSRQSIITTTLPFITFIIALGLINLNRFIKYATIILMIFEVSINTFYLSPEVKNANNFRPAWIKYVVEDAYNFSINTKVAISDNLVSDITPFLGWLSPLPVMDGYEKIEFPYKFRQAQVSNIKIIRTEDTFYFCGLDKPTYVIASSRDLAKIQKWLNIDTPKTVQKIYLDDLGNKIAYTLKPTICMH